jgi:hypothetical protein
MEAWFCALDDLANPKNGLNLVPNPLWYQDVMHNPTLNNLTGFEPIFVENTDSLYFFEIKQDFSNHKKA